MKQIIERYVCEDCGKAYDTETAYDACRLSHDIVYVGLSRQEWRILTSGILAAANAGFEFGSGLGKLIKYKFWRKA